MLKLQARAPNRCDVVEPEIPKKEFLQGDLLWEWGRQGHGDAQAGLGTYPTGRHKRGKMLLPFCISP